MEKTVTQKVPDEARTAGAAGGGFAMWEPGDDLCPPWWPRRPWPPRASLRPGESLPDLIAAHRVYDGLALMAVTFRLADLGLAREARLLGLKNAREAAEGLARGASAAWEPGDDPCGTPPRRWWPWPGPPPWWLLGGPLPDPWHTSKPQPAPWLEALVARASEPVPALGNRMLDTLGLLSAYSVAAKVTDAKARGAVTQAIGAAVRDSLEQLAHGA